MSWVAFGIVFACLLGSASAHAQAEPPPTDAGAPNSEADAAPAEPAPTPPANEPEIDHASTTREAPEELPENTKNGPLLKALPEPIQGAAAGLAEAHVPSYDLIHGVLDVARTRTGSGTSWLPANSPLYGLMTEFGRGWGFLARGNIFAGFDWFSGKRGGRRFVSTNSLWFMLWHALGRGEIMPRLVLSWEALTVKNGYPLIVQTGETVDGRPLRDRQNPQDLFAEIAVVYSVPLSAAVALQIYLALVGEPALGPCAYRFRVSAFSDPLAPIGSHWEDSTYSSAGVITVGVFTRELKLDMSWFNGREPDDQRYDLDLALPNSYAARVTWNPRPDWSAQTSYGYIGDFSDQQPGVALHRWTASATYNRRDGPEENWASTLVIGTNVERGHPTIALLAESSWNFDGHQTVFGRVEFVQKEARQLGIIPSSVDASFRVGTIVAGYVYYFRPLLSLSPGIGVRGAISPIDAALEPFYGTRVPVGVIVYAQLRPAALAVRN